MNNWCSLAGDSRTVPQLELVIKPRLGQHFLWLSNETQEWGTGLNFKHFWESITLHVYRKQTQVDSAWPQLILALLLVSYVNLACYFAAETWFAPLENEDYQNFSLRMCLEECFAYGCYIELATIRWCYHGPWLRRPSTEVTIESPNNHSQLQRAPGATYNNKQGFYSTVPAPVSWENRSLVHLPAS